MGKIVNIIEEKEHISFEVRYPKRKDYLYNDWLNKEVEMVEVGEDRNIKNTVVGGEESKEKFLKFGSMYLNKTLIGAVKREGNVVLIGMIGQTAFLDEKCENEEKAKERLEEILRELRCS